MPYYFSIFLFQFNVNIILKYPKKKLDYYKDECYTKYRGEHMQIFTITIHSKAVIDKLISLDKKKGAYISRLIEADIKYEDLERRVKELEGKK